MPRILFILLLCLTAQLNARPTTPIRTIPAVVDFDKKLQQWDGFGFNYVETAQTRNYDEYRQDYGGFSLLNERQKQDIIDLVFSEDGLDIDIVKMFLDPWHQSGPDAGFDHETTTRNMLFFVENGLKRARRRGKEIDVITTLYGPPPWATRQKIIGGRDLDKSKSIDLACYIIHWADFLRQKDINVKYLSIHNEGEDFYRWNFDDGTQRLERFDYNMYWPPEQVNQFINVLAAELESRRIENLGITNGEPSNWTRFYNWGYAAALCESNALDNLALLTTHGFINGDMDKLSYGTANSLTTRLLRAKKPGLHAWITSMSWGDLSSNFVKMIYEHIYTARVNAVIPWAGIQNPSEWIGGDTNLGTAIRVNESGYEITMGYYFYKQLTRAGRKGMSVVETQMANPVSNIIAFSGETSGHPDAFVVTCDIAIWKLPFEIHIKGSRYKKFKAYRTLEDGSEMFEETGIYPARNGKIIYDAPRGSVTTFIGIDDGRDFKK